MPRVFPFRAGDGWKVVFSVSGDPLRPAAGDVTSEACVLFLLARALARRGLALAPLVRRAHPRGLPFPWRRAGRFCARSAPAPLALLLEDLSDCNLHRLRAVVEAALRRRARACAAHRPGA